MMGGVCFWPVSALGLLNSWLAADVPMRRSTKSKKETPQRVLKGDDHAN